ncbi:hypothetical protein [Suttonella ornithocola]|uniref:Uncharacterized protein n=1 Tax=Suttonella ornithocola TaxID=279832 RepID=A0A380MLJ3_9GAMM|nr:hypothetical protein [Suttonella ornithocola]SUO93118.1 Uncharacterised protein [Suttonella ornithocola]
MEKMTPIFILISYLIFFLIITKGHPIQYIKAVMEKSRNAEEQHWGTFALIMASIIVFVFLLIQL